MAAGDIYRWISNSSTDWNTGANWDQGSVPGAAADGEIAIFDGTGQASVAGGDESTANTLGGMIVEPAYTGDIGGSGSPLIHNFDTTTDNDRLIFRGAGDLYFQGGGAGLGQQDYIAVIDAPGSTVQLTGDANSELLHLYVKAGNVTVTDGPSVQLVLYGLNATVTMNDDATDPWFITVIAGELTSARTLNASSRRTSVRVEAGKFTQTADMAQTDLYIGQAGWLDYRPTSEVGSATNSLHLNGVLDYRNAKYVTPYAQMVVGPLATIMGNPKEGATVATGFNGRIDLRNPYPGHAFTV